MKEDARMWRQVQLRSRVSVRLAHAFYCPENLQNRVAVQIENNGGVVVRISAWDFDFGPTFLQTQVSAGFVQASLDNLHSFISYPSWAIQAWHLLVYESTSADFFLVGFTERPHYCSTLYFASRTRRIQCSCSRVGQPQVFIVM